MDYFSIAHISRHDNWRANELAQQAFGYHVDRGMFHISQRPMSSLANVGEAEPEPTISATNEKLMQEKIKTGGNPSLIIYVILVEGWTGLFGICLSSTQ